MTETYYEPQPDRVVTPEEKREALTELEMWVKNLRSGEYEQGQGKLRSVNDKYCCAGVITEQFIASRENFLFADPYYVDGNYCYLNEQGNRAAGIASATIPTKIYHFFEARGIDIDWDELYRMNDGEENFDGTGWDGGQSFSQIADYIELEYIIPLKAELGI